MSDQDRNFASDAALETEVPLSWLPLLRDLDWFMLHKRTPDGPDSDLHDLHDRLVERAPLLLEPHVIDDLDDADVERMFAKAVLLLERLAGCVNGTEEILDTAGSWTLPLYEADYTGETGELERHCRALLSVDEDVYQSLHKSIDEDLADARRKHAVIEAVRAEFNLRSDAPDIGASEVSFFRAIHPGIPLGAEHLSVVVTGTLIFVCVRPPEPGDLAGADEETACAFAEQVSTFSAPRFGNFPAFGFVDPAQCDQDAVARLAARCGLSTDAVATELAHCVTLLPAGDMEKYLVHDVWGHSYQASMLQFEHLYAQVETYDEPWRPGRSPDVDACFGVTGSWAHFDAVRFRAHIGNEVSRRLPAALATVLAEMMADIAEYRLYVDHPEFAELLPQSSRLRHHPAKLDLTLRDVGIALREATRIVEDLGRSDEEFERLVCHLTDQGADCSSAHAAVRAARTVCCSMMQRDFERRIRYARTGRGTVRINAYTRLLVNFVGLHGAVLRTYDELDATDPSRLPLRGFHDLLILGAGVFFEEDPARNVWRLDEFLCLRFVALCRRLAGALDRD